MTKYESQCVGCPPELGCLGNACSNKNIPVYYCDICEDYADYKINENVYCEKCTNKFLNETFNDYTVLEKANLLDIKIKTI